MPFGEAFNNSHLATTHLASVVINGVEHKGIINSISVSGETYGVVEYRIEMQTMDYTAMRDWIDILTR